MNASLLLAIATLALVVGPLLERIAKRQPRVSGLVDGMTVGGILIVSLLHLMPESTAHLGLWAPLLLLVGLLLPLLTERLLVHSWQGWRITVGALVAVLFVAHLLAEGAALVSTANNERLALATVLVVAAHNLPLGVLLWGQTRRRFGRAWSVAVLATVGAITWFGPLVVPIEGESTFTAVCSALLAGGLLHLVLQHEPPLTAPTDRVVRNTWAALGTVAAAWFLIRYLHGVEGESAHAHGGPHLPEAFLHLFLETAPPLLLGVLAAGLIEAFLPDVATRWLGRGSGLGQALRGVVVGAPMPICSCGVLPIYRSLMLKGVPPTAAMAFLVAAPEIGIDSILLSLPLLGWQTTLARVIAALLLALAVGWFVGRLATRVRGPALATTVPLGERRGFGGFARGVYETWTHLGPWILFGLFATVFLSPHVETDWVRSIDPWLQVIVLSLIGMPSYICATAATPLAAMLLVSGFSPGAVLAFLLTGPATNWSTFLALRRLHSARVALAFALTALAVTFVIGVAVNAVLPEVLVPPAPAHGELATFLHWICAGVLCLLTLWVLLREGPRGFLSQLSQGAEPHEHPPADGPEEPRHAGHPHDEGRACRDAH